MAPRPYFVALFYWLWTLQFGTVSYAAEASDAELPAVVQKLVSAIEKKDAGQAQAQFTQAAWARSYDSGADFFEQASRKAFELRLVDKQRQGERAVLSVEIARAGKVVDRVFLYLLRQGGRWLIDALDESRIHPEHYLSGKLPAAFRVQDLPQNATLQQLGALITQAAAGQPEALKKMHEQVVDTSSTGYLQLFELRGATCTAAYYSEPLSSVALVFEKPAAPSSEPGPKGDAIVLYLKRQQALWHVYSRSYGSPSVRAMLIENRFYLKAPNSAPTR